ncbi:patatin-like phospholipase family protein [Barrientosiimonas marina]|uniref:Patatin-like phospholipase family protein n=1 Tax=Lentibacillus kimchii TaxID=1542911 RepID=A0ABW2UZW0_9BACI
MRIDGVFSGGGVKAYAFLGALERITANDYSFERVAGSSAGAIVAAFIAAGYQIQEMDDRLREMDAAKLLDPPKWTTLIPFSKWLNLYFHLGLNKGEKLENWIYQLLARKNVYTFGDLKPGYLKVVASDISIGKLVVIPDDLQRIYGINPANFPISKAVRMSAGFPYFFIPSKITGKTHNKSLIVDGGLLSNFPLWVFQDELRRDKRPILGMKLSDEPGQQEPHDVKNALDMFQALFSTMLNAHDARYISETDKKNILFIPVNHVATTDFSLTDASKDHLVKVGRERADEFLTYWPD